MCFLARLLPTLCWQFTEFPDQNQVNLNFLTSETGQSIESTWTLHHLKSSIDADNSNNKYVGFVKSGNDPYLVSNKTFLNSIRSEWLRSSDVISKLYYWGILILIVTIPLILLVLTLRCFRFTRPYYSSRQYINPIRHIFLGVIIVFSCSTAIKSVDYGDHFDEYSYVDIEKTMLERAGDGGALLPNW